MIDSFVDVRDVKEGLELHTTRMGTPYLLAICLLGAYQDVMGDHHNLFGRPPEIQVTYHKKGPRLEVLGRGETICELARLAGYSSEELHEGIAEFARNSRRGAGAVQRVVKNYEDFCQRSPYLDGKREHFKKVR